MDWFKLFTLCVAVVFISVNADVPKKKIRIHLPQKVKHIHHHKKIYITNHPASSQYAPAYLPSAEGTVAVPTKVLPAVANIVPINSVNIYDENQPRVPNISPAASQLLPLYHARGYYGPTPNEIEDVDYDIGPSSEPIEYSSPGFPTSAAAHSSHPPKRIKIIKINEHPKKKVIRKIKPKRIVVRSKPQVPTAVEGELPVSTFHEQFYSDIDGSGTIRKIRKPPRVEKIVDGDTEHIHTYSEEHIHKLYFDESPKVAGVVGVDSITGMSAISAPQHIIPFKNAPTLVAIPSNSFTSLPAINSVSNPSNFEYAAYNPREVTHDHIFHDHGEIPADFEINKENLALPPKHSYNSQGLRISGSQKRHKHKNSQKVKKVTNPTGSDFSYYENIYTTNYRPKKVQRPSLSVPEFETTGEAAVDEYRSIPNFGYKEVKKPRHQVATYYGKSLNDYRGEQASVPTPFAVSSTVIHEYKPKRYTEASSTNFQDPFANFNNFEYDTYASSSNIYKSEDKKDASYAHQRKSGKKKSISTQNISFGGQDHITWNVDHLGDQGTADDIDSNVPSALDLDQFEQTQINNVASPKVEQYFSLTARNINNDQLPIPEASNINLRYAEAPTPSITTVVSPTISSSHYNIHSTEASTTESPKFQDNRNKESNNKSEAKDRYVLKKTQSPAKGQKIKNILNLETNHTKKDDAPLVRGTLKYGDKI